jgi:hypothetical protein
MANDLGSFLDEHCGAINWIRKIGIDAIKPVPYPAKRRISIADGR